MSGASGARLRVGQGARWGGLTGVLVGPGSRGAASAGREHGIPNSSSPGTVASSDQNLALLRDIIAAGGGNNNSSSNKGPDDVSRDEFTLWLLALLGRVDAVDIKGCRAVFDAMAPPAGGGVISAKEIETVVG